MLASIAFGLTFLFVALAVFYTLFVYGTAVAEWVWKMWHNYKAR